MTTTTRWAVLGPGAISRDFVIGLASAEHGILHAVGSSSPERADVFAGTHGASFSGSYADVLARDDVDAVYIGTVHTGHRALAIAALEAGKAVLCEKPATPTSAETEDILRVAYGAGVPFAEAYKNRFGPFAEALRTLIASGDLGRPVALEAAFGFAAGERTGRLFDPALAGGAILDVGCYPLSLAVEVARMAGADATPTLVSADGEIVADVDGHAVGDFLFADPSEGLSARMEASVIRHLPRSALIRCEGGEIFLPDAWGGRAESATTIVVRTAAGERVIEVPQIQPMGAEADAISLALADGRSEVPEVPWGDTRAIAEALTQWRTAVCGPLASED
jgi:dihydrodiol dehydrogenase / D-xylose 1-dehydrogenase (NADP)